LNQQIDGIGSIVPVNFESTRDWNRPSEAINKYRPSLTMHFEQVLLEKMSVVAIDNEDHGRPSLTYVPLNAWVVDWRKLMIL
jgi:hypothetical protein